MCFDFYLSEVLCQAPEFRSRRSLEHIEESVPLANTLLGQIISDTQTLPTWRCRNLLTSTPLIVSTCVLLCASGSAILGDS